MENWKNQLVEWKEELLRSSGNDVLIHIPDNSKKIIPLDTATSVCLPYNSTLIQLIKEKIDYEKQAGVNSLCVVQSVLQWSDGKKLFESPLYLSEAFYAIDKVNKLVHITYSEYSFLNPFLSKKLEQLFDIQLENSLAGKHLPAEWQIISNAYLGNFHYHRFSLLKDVESYLADPESENSLIGSFYTGAKPTLNLNNQTEVAYVFPTDEYQTEILTKLNEGNSIVVKGPPGSGKSQLIANAAFQAALLNKKVVVSSEKLAALDVIKDKLKSINLGLFCEAIFNDSQEKTTFVQALKETWIALDTEIKFQKEISTFPDKKESIQQKLNRLNQLPDLSNCSQKPSFELSYYPDKKSWLEIRPYLHQLNEKFALLFDGNLSTSVIFQLNPSVFKELKSIENVVKDAQLILETSQLVAEKIKGEIELKSIADWKRLHRLSIHAQILTHDLFNRNRAIFVASTKEHKSFEKTANLFKKLTDEIQNSVQSEIQKWENKWSESEIHEALDVFEKNKWWTLRFRKWKSRFITDYKPIIFSTALAQNALLSLKKTNETSNQLVKVKHKLIDLGISHPESEITIVESLLLQYNQLDQNVLNTLHTYSKEVLNQCVQLSHEITQINRFLSLHFSEVENYELHTLLTSINRESEFIQSNRELIQAITSTSISTFKAIKEVVNWDELDAVIAYGQLMQFKNYNPELFHYSGTSLHNDLMHLVEEENVECTLQANKFIHQQIQKFNTFHTLLNTPAAQLSEEQKRQKVEIRKGRSILVKEFSKSRQHLSIRELLESPAKHWISILKPILLVNPISLSKILPNEKYSVDLLIMDEASQIPFVHAIPGIYRAKQVCVVGDPMQMAPSSYFMSGSKEREDVLSKALFHFESFELRYHYRSQQPELIAFSNKHFYENKLQVFPSAAKSTLDGIHSHYVNNGRYINRTNLNEAKQIVKWISNIDKKAFETDTFAIVAFSESQINCIVKEIAFQKLNWLEEFIEKGSVYFTTLENMQGDECDILVISFGYGFDEDEKFALRFGPINQLGGEKRLNVLFSRSRKGIHLFHSVISSDFSPSENLGVELMRKYLMALENQTSEVNTSSYLHNFGFDVTVDEKTKKIHLENPYTTSNALSKLVTLYRLATSRGWKVSIGFSKDKFLNT